MTNKNTMYPALNEKEIKSSQYILPPVISGAIPATIVAGVAI